MIRQLRVLLVSIFVLGLSCTAFAQNTQLQGQVSDSSGAVIPKALVRVVDQRTGSERKVQTNGSGQYVVPGLDPSLYKVFAQAEGFSTAVSTPITLNVGQNAVLDFKMQVGQATQSVTVDASGLQINTTDGSVSTVIDRQFVENTPLNGRSFQDLILLTPGVVTQSPQATGNLGGENGDFSVNGQRAESNYYTVDGIAANTSAGVGGKGSNAASGSVPSSTALGTTQSLVSVDDLQEFRVSSSTYSAEYGRTPGGQFSFVTRSGTDTFHGTVFDYLRNNYFDANDWFNDHYGVPQAALRQNDFGGTIGGPIYIPSVYSGKGKSFFFVSYEGLRLTQPQAASLQYVPSLSLRTQAPAALQPILNAFPSPTSGGVDYGNGLAQFLHSYSLPSQIDSTSVRYDQTLSSKLKAFFRFSDSPSSSASRQLSVYEPTTNSSRTYTGGLTAVLSDFISDDLRIGYVSAGSTQRFALDDFAGAQPINLAQALGAGDSSNAQGLFDIDVPGTGATLLDTEGSNNRIKQWNITDSLVVLKGHNTIKLGFDYRRIASPFVPASPSVTYLYYGSGEVIANSALIGEGIVSLGATPIYHEFSAFAQDEWRLDPRLTLSFGLRWEVNPPPGANNGDVPYVLQGNLNDPSTLALAPRGTALWKTTWYNLTPRLGAAWTANKTPGKQTIFRAGGGAFFDTGNEIGSYGYESVGFSATKVQYGVAAPFPGVANLVPSVAPPYTGTTVLYTYPHLQLPYTLEWSAALEQELGNAQALTITYIGSNGRRLLGLQEYSLTSQNPNFGNVDLYYNGPTSNYQALQLQFQRTVSHGLQALASYTWSHSLDFGSNAATIPLVRGNSDFDVRNNFTAGATWQIPVSLESAIATVLLKGWALDGHFIARSGFPVTLEGNQLENSTTGSIYYGGVNYDSSKPIYLYGAQYPGGRALNGGPNVSSTTAALSLPTGNQSGNAPRNFVRGFGATQFNLAARRDFKIFENLTLQARAETFNLMNHPNFGYVDPALTNSTFGQATQMLNQSLVTVASQYQQGGPRSMQFALKLMF